MSCTVNVKGEGQKRFDSLSNRFGARAALETFLQEDGTADIDGFISDVEQSNRVNAITFAAIEGLIDNAGGFSILDINNLKLESEDVANAIYGAKMRIERILEDALSVENPTELDKYTAARSFVALENFEQLIPKVKNRFKSLGLTMSELHQDLEEAYEEELAQNSDKEHIYQLKNIEKNRLDSVKPSVKLFLATLPEKRFDEEGNVVEATDDIGMRMPVDFHSLYSILSKNLADKASMEDMYDTLDNLAEEIPIIQTIRDYLETGVFDAERQKREDFRKIHSFENSFFNSFANTYNQSLTITHKSKKEDDGSNGVTTSILYTDKRRTDRVLKGKWAANAFTIINQPKAAKLQLWNDVVYDIFNPGEKLSAKEKKKVKDNRNKKLKNPNSKVILEEVSNSLALLGINVNPQALSLLRKKLNKKNPKTGFMDFVNKDLPFIAEQMYKNGVNIFKDEGSTLNILAEIQAEITADLGASSYMNAEGNQVYPVNLPSYFSELFNELFNKSEDGRFQDFLEDDFYANFKLLKDLQEDNHGMQVALFDSITDNDSNVATPFDALDPVSSMATRMALFMNYNAKGRANRKYSWILMPTPADRGNSHAIKVKTLEEGLFPMDMSNLFSDETSLKAWVMDKVETEFNRIKAVRNEFNRTSNKDTLIPNYHAVKGELGNGGYFNYFPELNQFLNIDENGSLVDIDFNSEEVQEVLQELVENQIQADIDYLADIGFLEPLATRPNGEINYSNFKLSEQAKRSLPKAVASDTNIVSFIVNTMITNHEVSALLQGDIAHFNSIENKEAGTRTVSFESANKRAGLAFTPGQKLRIGEHGARPTFSVAFAKDVISSSENITTYFNILNNKQANKYEKTDSTDGQGLVSLTRYMEILDSQGMLTPALETTINELKKPKDKINWDKVTESLVPVKGFHHGLRFDENFGRIMPKNLKYSLYPIVPSALENNPTMMRISNLMDKSQVDELVFSSGAKMGAYNFNDVLQEDLTELQTVEFDNQDWRVPQIVPYKDKTAENFGSQIRKLIEGNVKVDEYYGDKTGAELLELYQKAITKKIELSFGNMVQELSKQGDISIEKVAQRVLDDLSNNAYKSTSDFINKALEIIETASGELDTRIPMSFPAIKHKVESSLNSLVRKAVTKQDIPGFNGVISTALGYNKNSIKVDKKLEFIRKTKKGEILPAQIIVSPQYFANSLREQRKSADSKTKKKINELLNQMRSGDLDISAIPKELLQGVIYRIPTQGKNSMLPIEITGFTPEALSTNVILPSEIVTQSGSDYDIDKVYVELKHFSYTAESGFTPVKSDVQTKKGVDNTIIDTHYAILTSPLHEKELLTPNHTDTLDGLRNDISEIYSGDTFGRQWSSLATQDDFRDKNQAGSIFIGIASNANTAHALFQNLNVTLRNNGEKASETAVGVKIDGEFVNSLSQTTNRQGGLISDDHVEIQTAAVDNASNPILGSLNINSITGSTYLFLVEAGMGLKFSTQLMNTPIIRDLVKRARINEANMGPDGAFETALNELVEDRDFDISDVYSSDFDIKQGVLESVMDSASQGDMTSSYDESILKAFLTYRKYGKDMNMVQSALRTDVKGPSQTYAANVIQANKLSKISGTYSNEVYAKRFNTETAEPIETITLDENKYKNHSIKTYEKLGLWGSMDLNGRFIADSTPVFNKVLNSVTDLIGNVNAEADIRLLMNDFYTYLFANQDAHIEGKRSILAESDSDTVAQLLFGENSVGKKVIEAQKYDLSLAKEDITHIPNQFLHSLAISHNHQDTGYDIVQFNNTIARSLTNDQKSMLANEYLRLLTDENSFFNTVGIELFAYNFFTEGFSRGVNSFSEFIPIELYEHYTDGEGGLNLVDFFRDIYQDFNSSENFNITDFAYKFLRNRGTQLKSLKNLSRRKRSQIKEFLKANPNVKVFLFNSGGKLSIGRSLEDGKGNYSGIGTLLGVPKLHIEYQTGDQISDIISSSDVLERKKQSEDIREAEDSTGCI